MDLAHKKGVMAGRIYAASLLRPASTMKKPANPYPIWLHPFKNFAFRLGFSMGAFELLYRP